jgi:hypothetical protein
MEVRGKIRQGASPVVMRNLDGKAELCVLDFLRV